MAQKRHNPRDITTLSVYLGDAKIVLQASGYVPYYSNGWIRYHQGKNRFHAFIGEKNQKIDIHYDKDLGGGRHSSIIKDCLLEEVDRIEGVSRGQFSYKLPVIPKPTIIKCKREKFTKIDLIRYFLRPRPKYMPRFFQKTLFKILFDTSKI